MNKTLIYFGLPIIWVSLFCLASCSSKDDVKPPEPTVTVSIINGDGNFERNDLITYVIRASIPGGLKQGSSGVIQPSGIGSNTPFPSDVVLRGDTAIHDTMFLIVANGAAMGTHRLFVNITDESNQNVISNTNYTIVPTGQGGGGTVPFLSGVATVDLGSETNATLGSYLASSTGTVYLSSNAEANQATINLTFGIGNTGGPALISPDARASVGLNETSAPRTTFFKLETNGPTDLSKVTAINVENKITASSNKILQIMEGNTYSFVQDGATGKKGYIRITSLNNTQATVAFVVQQ